MTTSWCTAPHARAPVGRNGVTESPRSVQAGQGHTSAAGYQPGTPGQTTGHVATNLHNPAGPDDEKASQTRLAEWIAHWEIHGFGYEVIEKASGPVLGMAGVRHGHWMGVPVLNLYYRLAPEA